MLNDIVVIVSHCTSINIDILLQLLVQFLTLLLLSMQLYHNCNYVYDVNVFIHIIGYAVNIFIHIVASADIVVIR